MLRSALLSVLSVGVTLISSPAVAAPPTWCTGYTPSTSDTNAHWVDSTLEREGLSFKSLNYMARAACDKPNDAERQAKVEGWKAKLKEAWALSDSDFADSMAVYVQEDSALAPQLKAMCADLKASAETAPDDASAMLVKAEAIGCLPVGQTSVRGAGHPLWWLDRPELTELERAVLVHRCVGPISAVAREDRLNPAFAFCLSDLKQLDRAKFDTQLAELKLPPYGVVMAREVFGEAQVKAKKLLAQYEGLAAKDAGWKRLIFEATAAGEAAWAKAYQEHQGDFDAAKAFHEKAKLGSKSAVAGCTADLRKRLQDALRAKKLAAPADARTSLDAVSYPLFVAFMDCASLDGNFQEAATAYSLLVNGRYTGERRGPRHEAYYSALAALNDIRADREKFPLQSLGGLTGVGDALVQTAYERTFNKVSHERAEGQIKALKPAGDTVTVTFKTVTWKEPIYDCKPTNRISRIAPDGKVEYEQTCTFKGTEKRTSTENPVDLLAAYAAGLKPGMMAAFDCDRKGDKRRAIPTAVYAEPEKKKFLGLFGALP